MSGTVGMKQKISLSNMYSAAPLICTEDIGNLPLHIETVRVVGRVKKKVVSAYQHSWEKDLVLLLKRKKEKVGSC